MTTDNVKIKTASEIGITNAKNTYIINDYKGTVGLRHTQYEVASKTTFPINALNNQQILFDLPTGDMAINIPESCLEFTTKFVYHAIKPCIVKLINGIWWRQDEVVPDTADVTTAPVMATKWVAVCTGPTNSAVILDSSDIKYNGLNVHTYDIGRKMNYYQSKISKSHSEAAQDTWFLGDDNSNATMTIDCRPYVMVNGVKTWKGATKIDGTIGDLAPEFTWTSKTDFLVTKYITLKIPFCYLSDAFLQESQLFYTNAVNAAWFQLYLRFNRNSLNKCFGNIGVTGGAEGLTSGTVITAIQMQVYEKRSNLFTSDLKDSTVISTKTQGCAVERMGTFSTYGQQTYVSHEAKKSVNDMMVLISPDDENENDSCFIHGFSTTYKAAEIVKILNDNDVSPNYNFFYDFNITLPTTGDLLFQPQGIKKLGQFKNITMASMNLLNNIYAHPNSLYSGVYWNLFQSVIIINCEAFKNDLMGQDVILDGMDTASKGPTFRFSFRNYDPCSSLSDGIQEPAQSTSTASGYQTLGALIVDNYFFYDAWNVIMPKQNKMVFTEDIEKFM